MSALVPDDKNPPAPIPLKTKPLKAKLNGKKIELETPGIGHVMETSGVRDADFSNYLFRTVVSSGHLQDDEQDINAALAILHNIGPTDAMEAILAGQAVMSNHLCMYFAKRGMEQSKMEFTERYSNLALRFENLFIKQMQALDKHRGKGQQQVTVIHQHNNQGGQGAVVTTPPGAVEGLSQK